MDNNRKKFKNNSPQAILTEKEYKYVSLQAVLNQTILENNEKSLKELLQEINEHLTELRYLLDEKAVCENDAVKQKCQKLITQFETCLVQLARKDVKMVEKNIHPEPDSNQSQLGQKVERIELEEKLKQMRQKRLNRLSTFVNEQAKLSEQRSEQSIPQKNEATLKTTQETEPSNQDKKEPKMFQKNNGTSNSRVADIRSSFGKGGTKINEPGGYRNKVDGKLPLKISTKPSLNSKIDSPKSPNSKRKFFSSINCLTEETKEDIDKKIEENDKMMNQIKHVQLKKVNISNPVNLEKPENHANLRKPHSPKFNRWNQTVNRNSESSDFKDDPPKLPPKKAIAVEPPKVDFPKKIQLISARSKSDLHESWNSSKGGTLIVRNNSFKIANKTISTADLAPISESKSGKEREDLESSSVERASFSTFRTSKDSVEIKKLKEDSNDLKRKSVGPVYTTIDFCNSNIQEKIIPKVEKTNYETIDFEKTNQYNDKPDENKLIHHYEHINLKDKELVSKVTKENLNRNIEKTLKDKLLNSCKILEQTINDNKSDHLDEIITLLNSLKNTVADNKTPVLFSPHREELSKLEKEVQTFRGLRRDLKYLTLSSHISKIYIDVKNTECPTKEHEKRRDSFLIQVNDLEKHLENRMDKNEEILLKVLEEQADHIGKKINNDVFLEL